MSEALQVRGTTEVVDGVGVVRMTSRFDTDIADLWDAVTKPERLARWIAEVTGDLRQGGEFKATFTSTATGPGRIEVCDAPRHLLVRMEGDHIDDVAMIEAWLTEQGDSTELVVEERGLGPASVHKHGAGWQVHIEDLGRHLNGEPIRDWGERWQELIPEYPPVESAGV